MAAGLVDIYGDEFPRLREAGLYAARINADGNCLFNALSDQLYDTQAHHAQIRNRVISYMRDHADYYKQYITVYPGGGVRRNPKRTNTSFSASQENGPTDEEIDTAFEQHLNRMAQGGTWGDNIEISAFGQAYDVDVIIYTRTSEQLIPASQQDMGTKPVVHIAHHEWEHFSSIRNLDGPHAGQGMPDIKVRSLTPEEERKQQERVAKSPLVQPWMIDHVFTALGGMPSKKAITHELHKQSGNMDRTVSALLDEQHNNQNNSSTDSSTHSSTTDADMNSYSSHTTPPSRNNSSASSPRSLPTQPSDASDDSRKATSTSFTASYARSAIPTTEPASSSASRSASPAKPNGPKRFRLLGPRPPATHTTSTTTSPQPQSKPRGKRNTPRASPAPTTASTRSNNQNPAAATVSASTEPHNPATHHTPTHTQSGSGYGHGGSQSRSASPSARLLAPRHRGRVEKPPAGRNSPAAAGGNGTPVVTSGVGGLELQG
ncbi:hypothetical protein MBLNU230_g2996t2 [Neophaeotheca triangularis]